MRLNKYLFNRDILGTHLHSATQLLTKPLFFSALTQELSSYVVYPISSGGIAGVAVDVLWLFLASSSFGWQTTW